MKSKLIFILTIFLVTGLIACSPKTIPTPQTSSESSPDSIVAEGHIVPVDDLYLAFQTRGKVDKIIIKKGDSVRKGDLLVSLADRENAQAAFASASLELVSAQQDFDSLNRNADLARAEAQKAFIDAQTIRAKAAKDWEKFDLDANKDDIIDAEADVVTYKDDLKDAQEKFDKYASLDDDNSKRKSAADDLEKAQEDYNESIRKLEKLVNKRDGLKSALDAALSVEAEAKRTLENAQTGADKDKLAIASARLDNAKAQTSAAQHNLDQFDLNAPFDGVIMDTNLTAGEWIGPEKWAVIIADLSHWFVDTSDLTELDVVNVTVGQAVNLTADALPDLTFHGTVEEISQAPENKGGDVLYKVHIRLIDPDPRLKWGMTMEVTFPKK
jgi:HlyD family secretion protein